MEAVPRHIFSTNFIHFCDICNIFADFSLSHFLDFAIFGRGHHLQAKLVLGGAVLFGELMSLRWSSNGKQNSKMPFGAPSPLPIPSGWPDGGGVLSAFP